jgi:hypothetical protein
MEFVCFLYAERLQDPTSFLTPPAKVSDRFELYHCAFLHAFMTGI